MSSPTTAGIFNICIPVTKINGANQQQLTLSWSYKTNGAHPYASEVFVRTPKEASVCVDGNRRHPGPLDSSSVVDHINLSPSHRAGYGGLALYLLKKSTRSVQARERSNYSINYAKATTKVKYQLVVHVLRIS